MDDKKKNNVGKILDKEIHTFYKQTDARAEIIGEEVQEYYNQIDLSKAETKIIENKSLEEKVSSGSKKGRRLLYLIPPILSGIGGYALFRYGFNYGLVQSIGMGIISTFGSTLLTGIYLDLKHNKKNS